MLQAKQYSVSQYCQSLTDKEDWIAVEEPLEIWLKQYVTPQQTQSSHLLTTMRTPGNDIELVKGWLHASGLVDMAWVLSIEATGTEALKHQHSNRVVLTLKPGKVIRFDKAQRMQTANSSCGVCGQQSIEWLMDDLPAIEPINRISMAASRIMLMPARLQNAQQQFHKTGALHAAALIDSDGNLIDIFEDVGRHNAMDKLVGNNLANLPGKFAVVLSGRVSFEMVQKSAKAGISMIIAVGAPTSMAVDLCREWNIALIGFSKSERFNLYHGHSQILDDSDIAN
ncbi:formate dehydrogenase accessory sulfurtransferase FdhD [Aliiglaciecola sp. LCG003]|uniref:formate dehydrogenase accessory sulfurtransferase FdhD n=1 Tax=Aliiglaciecola sp. LCG003 TaxID=3053655 RepID=UPI0025739431|nr:formate dehydrogenase accessory sulfurtransferase FdhD [Aliiglaciecola sp. LCG003]WJG08227.1 formate dehydrogenase accessory sulfurtransferase FdhD [Aliiglaciecola sp. LCG003]